MEQVKKVEQINKYLGLPSICIDGNGGQPTSKVSLVYIGRNIWTVLVVIFTIIMSQTSFVMNKYMLRGYVLILSTLLDVILVLSTQVWFAYREKSIVVLYNKVRQVENDMKMLKIQHHSKKILAIIGVLWAAEFIYASVAVKMIISLAFSGSYRHGILTVCYLHLEFMIAAFIIRYCAILCTLGQMFSVLNANLRHNTAKWRQYTAIYQQLFHLLKLNNGIYSVLMAFALLYHKLEITYLIYTILTQEAAFMMMLGSSVVLCIIRFFVTVCVASWCKFQASTGIKTILYELSAKVGPTLKKEINCFSLQVLHEDPKVATSIFDIDFAFVFVCVADMSAAIFILLQTEQLAYLVNDL